MYEMIEKLRKHISSLFKTDCNIYDIRLKDFANQSCSFCHNCPQKCDYSKTHLYGCYEAVRWDNKYISYCSRNFIFIAISIYDENTLPNAGIITGPILMGKEEDFEETYGLTLFDTSEVNHLTEILSAVFSNCKSNETEDIANSFLKDVYKELELSSNFNHYPIELEKELQESIITHDSKKSKELLNKLLGQIFFNSSGDLQIIKSRVKELIVLLSRSAIEGGANIENTFSLNDSYLKAVENFDSLEKLSIWLSNILNRYVSYVFEFKDVEHIDIINKITAYVKSNYMKKITLDDIAKHVYLSKFYVSKIFNEETNTTLSEYINNVRISKSKLLLTDNTLSLVDVANLTGFDDQSYFSKVFKSIVGVSPGTYKKNMGKERK